MIGSQLINCLLSYLTIRSETARFRIRYSFTGCLAEAPLFWTFGVPAVLTGALNSFVAWGAGALLVNQMGGYGEFGVYNAVLRVKQVPEILVGMLLAPILPVLSEAFGKSDRSTFKRTLLFSYMLATLTIVPFAILQTAAPALTLLPFGSTYDAHPGIVQWLMFHAILYALMFPISSVLLGMGKMWFSWGVNLIFAAVFGATAWLLVPRFGAAGYAASTVAAYVCSATPCVVFLYQQFPDVMRFLRWSILTVAAICIFAIGVLASELLSFGWAITVGAVGAASFLLLKYRLHNVAARQFTRNGRA
jgi:O-antigen/teichoic acid export membrane protein